MSLPFRTLRDAMLGGLTGDAEHTEAARPRLMLDMLSDWLPYRVWDPRHQLYLNARSKGFVLGVTPLIGADERTAETDDRQTLSPHCEHVQQHIRFVARERAELQRDRGTDQLSRGSPRRGDRPSSRKSGLLLLQPQHVRQPQPQPSLSRMGPCRDGSEPRLLRQRPVRRHSLPAQPTRPSTAGEICRKLCGTWA